MVNILLYAFLALFLVFYIYNSYKMITLIKQMKAAKDDVEPYRVEIRKRVKRFYWGVAVFFAVLAAMYFYISSHK